MVNPKIRPFTIKNLRIVDICVVGNREHPYIAHLFIVSIPVVARGMEEAARVTPYLLTRTQVIYILYCSPYKVPQVGVRCDY